MATYFAVVSGQHTAAIWATSPTGAATSVSINGDDELVSNGRTVSISADLTANSVTNASVDGSAAGGSFALASITLTADVQQGATVNAVLTLQSHATPTLIGTLTGGSASNFQALLLGGLNAAGPVTIVGSVVGGSANNARAVSITGPATLVVVGEIVGGTGGAGLMCNSSSGSVQITGAARGAITTGVEMTAGTLRASRAIGGAGPSGRVGITSGTSATVYVEQLEFGDLGASPVSGTVLLSAQGDHLVVMATEMGGMKTLVDPALSDSPLPANVRSGVTYEFGNKTGTCEVPPPASVLAGVPVDHAVGTAQVTSAAVQAACEAALAAFSGGRLANVATVASVGQQLADAAG